MGYFPVFFLQPHLGRLANSHEFKPFNYISNTNIKLLGDGLLTLTLTTLGDYVLPQMTLFFLSLVLVQCNSHNDPHTMIPSFIERAQTTNYKTEATSQTNSGQYSA